MMQLPTQSMPDGLGLSAGDKAARLPKWLDSSALLGPACMLLPALNKECFKARVSASSSSTSPFCTSTASIVKFIVGNRGKQGLLSGEVAYVELSAVQEFCKAETQQTALVSAAKELQLICDLAPSTLLALSLCCDTACSTGRMFITQQYHAKHVT